MKYIYIIKEVCVYVCVSVCGSHNSLSNKDRNLKFWHYFDVDKEICHAKNNQN